MKSIYPFYHQLPNKVCIHCGEEFEEQHESYAVECIRCINKDYQE